MANPASPPAIDWAMYQSKIAVPGLVESFKKQYEALKVPYPADKVSPQIDAQAKEAVRVYILQINYSFNWYLVLFSTKSSKQQSMLLSPSPTLVSQHPKPN